MFGCVFVREGVYMLLFWYLCLFCEAFVLGRVSAIEGMYVFVCAIFSVSGCVRLCRCVRGYVRVCLLQLCLFCKLFVFKYACERQGVHVSVCACAYELACVFVYDLCAWVCLCVRVRTYVSVSVRVRVRVGEDGGESAIE